MFSKKLSTSILSICDSRELTYETASELCDLSPRYFGSIARGQTAPSVNRLEKLCVAFERSPNELLGFTTSKEELAVRMAAQVVHYRIYPLLTETSQHFRSVQIALAVWKGNNQSFCSECGQKLFWDFYHYATPLTKR